jgi:hypothetical protein
VIQYPGPIFKSRLVDVNEARPAPSQSESRLPAGHCPSLGGMEFAKEFSITPSGRVSLLDGEIEIKVETGVSIYDGETKLKTGGTLTLTTQRLLYQVETFKAGFLLEAITEIQERSSWIGKSKLLLYFSPGKFVMVSIPRFPQFKVAIRDSMDSRKKSLAHEHNSRQTTIPRSLTNAGVGAVLKMKVTTISSATPKNYCIPSCFLI